MNITKYTDQYRKDLEFKNYSKNTIDNYVCQVELFLKHHSLLFTDPSRINESAIKEWIRQGKSVNGIKHRISALKLFYIHTIKQPLKFKHIEYPRAEKKLPIVLSVDEIQKMFDVCKNLKHKVMLVIKNNLLYLYRLFTMKTFKKSYSVQLPIDTAVSSGQASCIG